MNIKRTSWHYRFNKWATNKLGGEDIEKKKTLCSYFWKTVGNFVILLTSPIWWLLTEPITPEKTPIKIIKDQQIKSEGRFSIVERLETCGFGLIGTVFLGSFFIIACLPIMALIIWGLTGSVSPDLLGMALVSCVLYIFGLVIFFLENRKYRKFIEFIKGNVCPFINFTGNNPDENVSDGSVGLYDEVDDPRR